MKLRNCSGKDRTATVQFSFEELSTLNQLVAAAVREFGQLELGNEGISPVSANKLADDLSVILNPPLPDQKKIN